MTCRSVSRLAIPTRWAAPLLTLLVLLLGAQPLRAAGALARAASPTRQAARHGPAMLVGGNSWIQKAEFSPSELQHNDQFGGVCALSADGTTAIVSSVYDDNWRGSVFVYTWVNGIWSQQAKLTASDGVADDQFGWSIALSADGAIALISAPGRKNGRGAAYRFARTGTTWSEQASIILPDGMSLPGGSLALSSNGSTAVIGDMTPTGPAYLVYAYQYTGKASPPDIVGPYAWVQQATLAPEGAAEGQVAISASGGTVLIGAKKDGQAGAAYLFIRSYNAVKHFYFWSQQAKITAFDGQQGDDFGAVVALSADGSTALVTALNRNQGEGAVYVYVFQLGKKGVYSWTWQAELVPPTSSTGGIWFAGAALCSDGNTALITAVRTQNNRGVAYLFTRTNGWWTQQAEISAFDGVAGDGFGVDGAISADGTTVIVTAPYTNVARGAAYVFEQN